MTSKSHTSKIFFDSFNDRAQTCNNLENGCALSMKQKLINDGFWFVTEDVNNCVEAKPIALYLHSIPEDCFHPQQKHAKLKELRLA